MVTDQIAELKQKIVSELTRAVREIDPEQISGLVREIRSARRVFVHGKGRMGLVLKTLAAGLYDIGVDAHVIGEVTVPPIARGDLLIVTPTGGDPKSSTRFLQVARDVGARVAAFTANRAGPVGALADVFVEARARTVNSEGGDVPSVQPMSTTLEQAGMVVFNVVLQQVGSTGPPDLAKALVHVLEGINDTLVALDENQVGGAIGCFLPGRRGFFIAEARYLLVLACFAMRIYHLGQEVYVSNQARWPLIGSGDLIVALTGLASCTNVTTTLAVAEETGASLLIFSVQGEPEWVTHPGAHSVALGAATRGSLCKDLDADSLPSVLVALDYIAARIIEAERVSEQELLARHTNLE